MTIAIGAPTFNHSSFVFWPSEVGTTSPNAPCNCHSDRRRSRGSALPGPNPRVGRDGDLVRRDKGEAPRVEDGRLRGLRRGGEVQSRGAPSRAIESNDRGPRLRDTPEEEATITSGRDYRKRAAVRETPKSSRAGGRDDGQPELEVRKRYGYQD